MALLSPFLLFVPCIFTSCEAYFITRVNELALSHVLIQVRPANESDCIFFSLSPLRSMDAFSLGRIQVDEPAVDGQMGEIKSKYSHSLILIQQMLIACFCPCTFFHSARFSTLFSWTIRWIAACYSNCRPRNWIQGYVYSLLYGYSLAR